MESIQKHLATKHGIKLSAPGYNGYDPIKGDTYTIQVSNPNHVEKGIVVVVIDGRSLENFVISYVLDGKMHDVLVIMG